LPLHHWSHAKLVIVDLVVVEIQEVVKAPKDNRTEAATISRDENSR
jgi:hypothetical protein